MTDDSIVIPPTMEVKHAASMLYQTVPRFSKALRGGLPIGKWESETEAYVKMLLVLRHVESLSILARTDLVLLPAAVVIARAAFETATGVLWMLDPEDPFEREVRWLAQLAEEEEYYERLFKKSSELGGPLEDVETRRKVIGKFRTDVEGALPDGYETLKRVPNFAQMLGTLGLERQYLLYMDSSQFTHGTQVATGL